MTKGARLKSTFKAISDRLTARLGPAERFLLVFLICVVIVCLLEIMVGDSPWTDKVRELLAAGEKLGIRQRIAIGIRYGVYFTLGGAVFLLLISPWWATKREIPVGESGYYARIVPWQIFYVVLAAAVVTAAWFRVPMMHHSFWNDEELAFRKFNWGEYRTDENGDLVFKPLPWDYAFFYTISGNNHIAQTVLSKATHEWWLSTQPESDHPRFSEAAVRIGPVIFGLLTIAAFALALRSVGLGVAGLIGAWILALHPWHVEYSTEARGYSGMLFFIVLSFWSLGKALAIPKWKWWLMFGVFQALYLLHFAGAIYLAAATNAIIFGVLLWKRAFFGMRRWFVSGVLSLMAFIQMMAPSLMAIFGYMSNPVSAIQKVDKVWLSDLWAHISLGMGLAGSDASLAWGVGERNLAADNPVFGILWIWIIPIFLFCVVVGACVRMRYLSVFFGSLILAAALAIGHSTWKSTILLEWYLLYLILGVALAFGLIGEWVYRSIKCPNHGTLCAIATAGAGIVIAMSYGITTGIQRNALRFHDVQPMREAVEMVRGESQAVDSRHSAILTASIGPGAEQLRSYDPRVLSCENFGEFKEVAEQALKSGKPLWVYCSGPKELKRRDAELHREVVESGRFTKLATLKGVEDFWSYQIYQMKMEPPLKAGKP